MSTVAQHRPRPVLPARDHKAPRAPQNNSESETCSSECSTKSFFWNYDGSNEVEYDYDYTDQTNFPGAVKLWKKDGSNTGWYKVYNNCEDGIGKDGKVGCYLHFYCLDWNTDDLGSDC